MNHVDETISNWMSTWQRRIVWGGTLGERVGQPDRAVNEEEIFALPLWLIASRNNAVIGWG